MRVHHRRVFVGDELGDTPAPFGLPDRGEPRVLRRDWGGGEEEGEREEVANGREGGRSAWRAQGIAVAVSRRWRTRSRQTITRPLAMMTGAPTQVAGAGSASNRSQPSAVAHSRLE